MTVRCTGCGLINGAGVPSCRRCGAALALAPPSMSPEPHYSAPPNYSAPPPAPSSAPNAFVNNSVAPTGQHISLPSPQRFTSFAPGAYGALTEKGLDPRDVALRSSARNWLYILCALKAPLALILTIVVFGSERPIDGVGWGIFVGTWMLTLSLGVGAYLVGDGKKIGMWIAAPALLLLMCGFPIGTILAITAARKVSNAANAQALL